MPMYTPARYQLNGKLEWVLLRYGSIGDSCPYKTGEDGTILTYPTKAAADRARRSTERRSTMVDPTPDDIRRIQARRNSLHR